MRFTPGHIHQGITVLNLWQGSHLKGLFSIFVRVYTIYTKIFLTFLPSQKQIQIKPISFTPIFGNGYQTHTFYFIPGFVAVAKFVIFRNLPTPK